MSMTPTKFLVNIRLTLGAYPMGRVRCREASLRLLHRDIRRPLQRRLSQAIDIWITSYLVSCKARVTLHCKCINSYIPGARPLASVIIRFAESVWRYTIYLHVHLSIFCSLEYPSHQRPCITLFLMMPALESKSINASSSLLNMEIVEESSESPHKLRPW